MNDEQIATGSEPTRRIGPKWWLFVVAVVVVVAGAGLVVWQPWTAGGSEDSPEAESSASADALSHRLSEDLCERVDWSPLEEAWTFDPGVEWGMNGGSNEEPVGTDGTGNVGCGGRLPVEAAPKSMMFRANIRAYTTENEARERIEGLAEVMPDAAEKASAEGDGQMVVEELSLPEMDGCDLVSGQVVYVGKDRSDDEWQRLQVLCHSGNLAVYTALTWIPDFGYSEADQDLDLVVDEVMVPVVNNILATTMAK